MTRQNAASCEEVVAYNGPRSTLMDKLWPLLVEKYGGNVPDEAVLSLYLARACSVIEKEERGK